VFFSRQLESIAQETYDTKFPSLKHRQFIPVDGSDSPGAMSTTYRQYTDAGEAKIISGNAKDIPRGDLSGAEFNRPVREVAMHYGWTWKELQAAMLAGLPLNARRAQVVAKAIERKLEEVACFGSAEHGIADGALNEGNVSVTASAGAWTGETPDTIISEVAGMRSRIQDGSLEAETPNTLLLPTEAYLHIANTPRGTGTDTTILQFLRNAHADIGLEIFSWWRCNDAGAGGVGRAVMYDRSPMTLVQRIPQEMLQLPPEAKGLETLVYMLASTAGTEVHYPGAMDYLDGVKA